MLKVAILLRRLRVTVEWIVSHAAEFLWLLAIIWLIFACSRLVAVTSRVFPKEVDPVLAYLTGTQFYVDVFGILIVLLAIASVYIPRKHQFRLAWSIFRNDSVVWMATSGLIDEYEVQRRLAEFSRDATEIKIVAGDGAFLNSGLPQYEETRRFGSACRVLLEQGHRLSPSSLHGLAEAGVDIRVQRRDLTFVSANLRGRLKRSATGAAACLFDRDVGGYRVVSVSNELLVQLIAREYDRWFDNARNPIIKYIVFDAGGVAFDGDIADFYARVQRETSVDLHARAEDYSLVDRELNLGNCDIVDVIRRRAGAVLADDDVEKIRAAWSITWSLNSGMAALSARLRLEGLSSSICSNCDRENGDLYEVKGYFDSFDRVFLSCDMQLLKPDESYFRHILNELRAEPWQVLFIDDARLATDEARKIGFEVLTMPRIIAASDKAAFVERHLIRLKVLPLPEAAVAETSGLA